MSSAAKSLRASVGFVPRRSAAIPATWGVAIEVPAATPSSATAAQRHIVPLEIVLPLEIEGISVYTSIYHANSNSLTWSFDLLHQDECTPYVTLHDLGCS